VTFTKRDLLSIAGLSASLNVEGHRSDLVILKASRAQAAFEGRTHITERDIALAAELALPHRIKRGPFQESEVTMEELAERIDQLQGAATEGKESDEAEPVPTEDSNSPKV
jgi:Mg-chelatase subunit ChlI